MLSIIQNIPNINTYPLTYVFENIKLQHKPNTLWLEFGVASGNTINYISKFTNDKVYGFDSKKVSFIHMDADLYSSTKYIFDVLKDYIDSNCIIVFDELVNYPGFDGDTGELKAFYEFIIENKVDYEWIGMNGTPTGMSGYYHENVALIIHSIN